MNPLAAPVGYKRVPPASIKPEATARMLEFFFLLVGAAPLIVGLFALRMFRNDNESDSDDSPPPPNPDPPRPVLPPAPQPRLIRRPNLERSDRQPVARSRTPHTRRRVVRR